MAEGSVTLSAEEAKVLCNVFGEEIDDLARGLDEQEQRALLRVVLKLAALDRQGDPGWMILGNTPQWIQKILRKTFTPPPAPAKKAAPKAAGRSPRKTAGPSRKPTRVLPKGAGQGLRVETAAGGALDAAALEKAHEAITRSHRSAAEKAEAHEALDAGAAAGGAR